MSNGSRLETLTNVQAVIFFVIAAVCVVVSFVMHQTAFFFLGLAIAACTVVSLIDKAAISPDNGGFIFVTGDGATWVNVALFAVAMVLMALSAAGTIRFT